MKHMPLKEVLADVARWQEAGERAAIARVVGVEGSSPREAGAAMAVSEGSEVAGSVSGGCVEGAVVEAALEILGGEREPGVITFGYSDEDAFAVGLTCGGTIHLFVEPVAESASDGPLYGALRAAVDASEPVALVTVVDGIGLGSKLLVRPDADRIGTLGDPDPRSCGRLATRSASSRPGSARPATTASTARRAKKPSRCSSSRSWCRPA